jgi:hypothetical protein
MFVGRISDDKNEKKFSSAEFLTTRNKKIFAGRISDDKNEKKFSSAEFLTTKNKFNSKYYLI